MIQNVKRFLFSWDWSRCVVSNPALDEHCFHTHNSLTLQEGQPSFFQADAQAKPP